MAQALSRASTQRTVDSMQTCWPASRGKRLQARRLATSRLGERKSAPPRTRPAARQLAGRPSSLLSLFSLTRCAGRLGRGPQELRAPTQPTLVHATAQRGSAPRPAPSIGRRRASESADVRLDCQRRRGCLRRRRSVRELRSALHGSFPRLERVPGAPVLDGRLPRLRDRRGDSTGPCRRPRSSLLVPPGRRHIDERLHAVPPAPAVVPPSRPHLARRPRAVDRLWVVRATFPATRPRRTRRRPLRPDVARSAPGCAHRLPAGAASWRPRPGGRPAQAVDRRQHRGLAPSSHGYHPTAHVVWWRSRGRRRELARSRRCGARPREGPHAHVERERERVGDGCRSWVGRRSTARERQRARCGGRDAHDGEELQELQGEEGQVRPQVAQVQPVQRPRRRMRLWHVRSRCVPSHVATLSRPRRCIDALTRCLAFPSPPLAVDTIPEEALASATSSPGIAALQARISAY